MVGMMKQKVNSNGSDLYTSLRRMTVARLNLILTCHTCQNFQLWNRSSHLSACQTLILYASNRETCRGGSNWRKNEQHTKYDGSINLEHPAARTHVMRCWEEMSRVRFVRCKNYLLLQGLEMSSISTNRSARYDRSWMAKICGKNLNSFVAWCSFV